MLEVILETLKIMGWLGIIFMILVVTNTISGALANIWSGEEEFSGKKMLQGILKAIVFFLSAVFISIAFAMLPFINEMITSAAGETLLSSEMLDTLSSVGVLGVVLSAVILQGKKALTNVVKLANISSDSEQELITWEVEEDMEEEE